MRRILGLAAVAIGLAAPVTASGQTFQVGGIGGAVVLPDGKTFVVSIPGEATLIYFDTVAGKELRRVELDFKPAALAAQGDTLFVATRGSSVVHLLDAATAKDRATAKLPGEPVVALACHPSSGLVYASDTKDDILAIDPKTGRASATEGKGQMLAIAPGDPKHLYAGAQKPIKDVLIIRRGPGGTATVSAGKTNVSAGLVKYEIDGDSLKAVAFNGNAAVNGRAIAVSADGSRIAMAGGGGWRSKTDRGGGYVVPVFETSDMETLVGQVETGPYPGGVAFHPKEPWGAAYRSGGEHSVTVFGKAFTQKGIFKIPKGQENDSAYLGFGADGTKLIFASVTVSPSNNKNRGTIIFRVLDASGKLTTDPNEAGEDTPGQPRRPARKRPAPKAARPSDTD